MNKRCKSFKRPRINGKTSKREPCLCCECKYWSPYLDQYGINWGECLKGKLAFPQMQKCKDFRGE